MKTQKQIYTDVETLFGENGFIFNIAYYPMSINSMKKEVKRLH